MLVTSNKKINKNDSSNHHTYIHVHFLVQANVNKKCTTYLRQAKGQIWQSLALVLNRRYARLRLSAQYFDCITDKRRGKFRHKELNSEILVVYMKDVDEISISLILYLMLQKTTTMDIKTYLKCPKKFSSRKKNTKKDQVRHCTMKKPLKPVLIKNQHIYNRYACSLT